MRDAKAQDYWNSAYKRKYTDNIVELDFKGLNNLPILAFPNGLLALCGLNHFYTKEADTEILPMYLRKSQAEIIMEEKQNAKR